MPKTEERPGHGEEDIKWGKNNANHMITQADGVDCLHHCQDTMKSKLQLKKVIDNIKM